MIAEQFVFRLGLTEPDKIPAEGTQKPRCSLETHLHHLMDRKSFLTAGRGDEDDCYLYVSPCFLFIR